MSKAITARKCSECGKRRIPAKRSNGKASTKCKECFSGLFWQSEFGRWFAEAAKRQSPASMPIDESDIKGIYSIWSERKAAAGYTLIDGQIWPKYEYHISHRDPATGNGFQGRFTTANLIIATAKANKMAYNCQPVDHGFRVYTDKKPFGTAAKVRQWCGGKYDLKGLVSELELTKYAPRKRGNYNGNPDYLPQGRPPQVMLERQLGRFKEGSIEPWRRVQITPDDAFSTVLIYGVGLGSGELDPSNLNLKEPSIDDF